MQLFGLTVPFADHCNIEELGFADGRTRLRLVLAPQHANASGVAHGGVICTLLDVAMGTVARLTIGHPVATLTMQTSFLLPGRGTLIAEGRVQRAGRSIVFCEADIRTETGDVIATGTGTMKRSA